MKKADNMINFKRKQIVTITINPTTLNAISLLKNVLPTNRKIK